jgi:hypothetical protein
MILFYKFSEYNHNLSDLDKKIYSLAALSLAYKIKKDEYARSISNGYANLVL